MKRRIIFAVALIMVACLAVTGCGKKTESQEILLTNEQSDGQAEIPVSQTATPEPAEYFSETPESLDGTAWILDNNPNQKERAAFFFKDGLVTYVSRDEIYKDSYRYKNNVLITDEINIGIVGDVNGGRLINVTYYGNPYPDMIRVEPSRAVQYVRELHPDFESPFDDGAEPASDTGYTSTDNSDPRFENGQYIYVVAGKEIRLSINVWDYVKIGSVYKRLDWKGEKPRRSRRPIYPADWQDQFGLPYYEHRQSMQINIFDGYAVYAIKEEGNAPQASLLTQSTFENSSETEENSHD